MTEAPDTTDRRVKWMRSIARALALLWAGWWSLSVAYISALMVGVLACFDCPGHQQVPVWGIMSLVMAACLALPFWASAAIAWRWEHIGGVVLILEAFLCIRIAYDATSQPAQPSVGDGLVLPSALLPLIAGILFLASWWISRTSGTPAASE